MGRRRGRHGLGWMRALVTVAALGLLFAVAAVVIGTAYAIHRLRSEPPPTSAFMWRARTADPATGQPCPEIRYEWVDWERIARDLPIAVVLAEDQRFLLHNGFDMKAIRKALRERERSGRERGASTLSQQVAKNLFLWPGGGYPRKGLEAWFTVWIERSWTKRRILEVYVNIAQFGPCVFGAEAAARTYFERSAAELEPEQAALLATVLPNPLRLRAWNPGPYARARRDEILKLMDELRYAGHIRGL